MANPGGIVDDCHGVPRLIWESDHEWNARKMFIETHICKFEDKDYMGSLSMAWANWKFMGNTYPPDLQCKLEELHAVLPAIIDEEIQELSVAKITKVKFVRAQEDLGGRKVNLDTPDRKKPSPYSNFIKSATTTADKESSTEIPTKEDKDSPPAISKRPAPVTSFASNQWLVDNSGHVTDTIQEIPNETNTLKRKLPPDSPSSGAGANRTNSNSNQSIPSPSMQAKNSSELVPGLVIHLPINPVNPQNTLEDSVRLSFGDRDPNYDVLYHIRYQDESTPTTNRFKLYIDDIFVSSGSGKRKMAGLTSCAQNALDRLKKCQTVVNQPLIAGLTLIVPAGYSDNPDLSSPISILHESVDKMRNGYIDWQEEFKGQLIVIKCCINGKMYGQAEAPVKKDAKRECADLVFNKLKQYQPIVEKKPFSEMHNEVKEVVMAQLVKGSYLEAPKIGESNMGNKLLRKMGWTGEGGVGKEQAGRADPVFVEGVEGRRGVGHEFADRTVKKGSVEETLHAFIRDQSRDQLKFDPGLSKEDRALIHRVAQKNHLKHVSYGKGEGRYLVVSKKSAY